jgi:hypothetical protein
METKMTFNADFTGGCLCGAVRYRIGAEPIMTRVCWCRDCQYFAAGSGTVNVVFPKSALIVSGELRDFRSIAASANVMHRHFCPVCGTSVLSEAEARPQLIIARAGTLDDPNRVRPSATIWTQSAPQWACIDTSLPGFEAQPPPV